MTKNSQWFFATLCFSLGFMGLAFGQGHYPNGLLLLAGITFWIRFFRNSNPWIAVPLTTIANLVVWEWAYFGMVPLPMAARLAMFGTISLIFAMLFLSDRWTNLRIDSIFATLILPCGWVTFDLLSARFSPGGTWASIAYAFADDLMFVQIVSLAGWIGITFFVVWIASAINWVWDRWLLKSEVNSLGVSIILVATCAVFTYGVCRLSNDHNGPPVRIACIVAPNTFNDEYVNDVWAYTRGVETTDQSNKRAKQRIEQSRMEHFEMVQSAAAFEPKFVVWPEANAVMTTAEEESWIRHAKEIAMAQKFYIGMGLIVFRPNTDLGTLNKFVLIDPDGNLVIDSLKATRVPGSLNEVGDGILPVVDSDWGRISSAICFDMDFPQLIAQAGSANIDLFFAPSNDWKEVCDIHAQMAKIRCIEQGFALVRPTKDGKTLLSDSTGRIVGSMVADDNKTAVLIADLPAHHRATVYSVIGDAFGYVCTALFLIIGFAALLRPSKSP